MYVCTCVLGIYVFTYTLCVLKYVLIGVHISTYAGIGICRVHRRQDSAEAKDHYANQVTLFVLLLCVCSDFGKRMAANARASGRRCIMVIASQRRVLGVNEKPTFCTQIDTH